jgi:hypothetical protein
LLVDVNVVIAHIYMLKQFFDDQIYTGVAGRKGTYMGNRVAKELIVTSANRKRRWKIFVASDRILTAVELYLHERDGEWKPLPIKASSEDDNGDTKH